VCVFFPVDFDTVTQFFSTALLKCTIDGEPSFHAVPKDWTIDACDYFLPDLDGTSDAVFKTTNNTHAKKMDAIQKQLAIGSALTPAAVKKLFDIVRQDVLVSSKDVWSKIPLGKSLPFGWMRVLILYIGNVGGGGGGKFVPN
jgi:hypothetical protein